MDKCDWFLWSNFNFTSMQKKICFFSFFFVIHANFFSILWTRSEWQGEIEFLDRRKGKMFFLTFHGNFFLSFMAKIFPREPHVHFFRLNQNILDKKEGQIFFKKLKINLSKVLFFFFSWACNSKIVLNSAAKIDIFYLYIWERKWQY